MGGQTPERLAVMWDGWLDFLAMGGHALYVWGSYAVAVALALTELVLLHLRRRVILGYLGWNDREL